MNIDWHTTNLFFFMQYNPEKLVIKLCQDPVLCRFLASIICFVTFFYFYNTRIAFRWIRWWKVRWSWSGMSRPPASATSTCSSRTLCLRREFGRSTSPHSQYFRPNSLAATTFGHRSVCPSLSLSNTNKYKLWILKAWSESEGRPISMKFSKNSSEAGSN